MILFSQLTSMSMLHFLSGWGTELGTNPNSGKSHTGYIVEVMGCSVIWCSELQPCIATSTMESEYTALSMALRAAIPLLDVTSVINKGLAFIATRGEVQVDPHAVFTLYNWDGQTVLDCFKIDAALNTGYRVKYPFFCSIYNSNRSSKSTNLLIHRPSSE
jgi:hypothetical protein